MTWRTEAKCIGLGDLFYLDVGQPSLAAKQVCVVCPVRIPCLKYALDTNEESGLWGGMAEGERARFRPRYLRGAPIPPVMLGEKPVELGRVIPMRRKGAA